MELIIFSPPSFFEREFETICYFLNQNIFAFHLRNPEFSKEDTIRFLNSIPEELHHKIMLHNHIELLEDFNLKGFHYTRNFIDHNSISLSNVREKHPKSVFSKSCHSINDIYINSAYDYVFLSPIFDSISKVNHPSAFSLNDLKSGLKSSKQKVFALGGVSLKNIIPLSKINFYGVAVLGDIWNNENPKNQFLALKELLLN